MFVHILILLFVCIAGAYYYWNPRIKKKTRNLKFLVVTFFPIWLVQTFRDASVGIDSPTYVNSFRNINQNGKSWENINWERGYIFINKLVWKLFGDNYHVLFGCVSLIILIGIGYFILENCNGSETFWAVFFFVTLNYYLTSMVSLRQYCALSIGINIFTVLNKKRNLKNYIKALILFLIAVMFHNSAIIFGAVLLLYLLGAITKKKLAVIVCVGYAIYCNIDKILYSIPYINLKFSTYMFGEHRLSNGVDFSNAYLVFLIGKTMLACLVFCLSDRSEKNNTLYELTFLVGIGIVFSILTTKMAIFFRFTYFFDIYLIIFIPKALNRLSNKMTKKIMYIGCFCFANLYYVYLLYTNCAKCVPYVLGV